MRKFIIRFLLIIVITILIILTRITILNIDNFRKSGFRDMPLNNVSNSGSFKAKLDHMISAPNYENCTFLVGSSSMSLNNISGQILSERTGETVYNMSSWNLKPDQLIPFFELMKKDKIRHVLLTFNNWDFGKEVFKIDFDATCDFLNGNKLQRCWTFMDKFNIKTFSRDWNMYSSFSHTNNNYNTLNFDEYGSVQFDTAGFVIDSGRWNAYLDTTGFTYFLQKIEQFDSICKKENIDLHLVYLPAREGLLKEENVIQNRHVSEVLRSRFNGAYTDMQELKIPTEEFADGIHLFKAGAERLTRAIADSLYGPGKVRQASEY
jgi:hypothetical protein